MTSTPRVKLFNYQLRALPNGKFQFLPVDVEDPKAPKGLIPDKTEEQVREIYRTKWGYSDAEIDERLRAAREKLKM
jgi:hypothetical protein